MGTQYKALHVGYILDYIHQSVYANPIKQILSAIFNKEGIKYEEIPEPKWGQLSQVSLESKVEYLRS
jgi:hypothetical protein